MPSPQVCSRLPVSILDLTNNEALAFLLKPESYFTLELPPYINFKTVLNGTADTLATQQLQNLTRKKKVRELDGVNYTILHNKDGRYAWRPFQLIHPALYVSLAQHITQPEHWNHIRQRFQEFAENPQINCLSLPTVSSTEQSDRAAQILQWWQQVEQAAIGLSLEYDYVLDTDITDCYGSFYTHSIAWALHTKATAKTKKTDKNLIGNIIDAHIQDMRHGQTNGIPQGSVLMDFIAEMVLGFADMELSKRLGEQKIVDYHILRYRDDYRVFVNNPQDGDAIMKVISEITGELGLKLNPSKTRASADVVRSSIKSDKLEWLCRKQHATNLQSHLLIIHDHGYKHPNSGSLARALNDFHKRLIGEKLQRGHLKPLIAIVTDIAYRNPRTYAVCAAILSHLLKAIEDTTEQKNIAETLKQKFNKLPNTGHMQIWLQRITHPIAPDITYSERLCQLVTGDTAALWNNDWISSAELRAAVDTSKIIDPTCLSDLPPTIQAQEFALFVSNLGSYAG